MKKDRILMAILVILGFAVLVLGVDFFQRNAPQPLTGTSTALPPGSVPIYLDGERVGGFTPADLEDLRMVSFVDAEEGKTQDGWPLQDVILLSVSADKLVPEAEIIVSSSSRNKSIALYWMDISDPANKVMFDLSNRGTVKLVSLMPELDTRDEWIQDVDKIEIVTR